MAKIKKDTYMAKVKEIQTYMAETKKNRKTYMAEIKETGKLIWLR